MTEAKSKGAVPGKEPEELRSKEVTVENEERIFTFNTATGELVKVEKVEPATGERKEISEEEYSLLYAWSDPYGDAYAALYDPYGYEAAYYQGIADYQAALDGLASYGSSSEEQAYLQGMADYAASLPEASA